MLNGGNFDETRRRTIKLTLDALTYSLLSFLFGLAFFSIDSADILFTDISIPSSLFQIVSIVYFLLFFIFSAALVLPVIIELVDQILDWAASSVIWHILTAILFYVTVAFANHDCPKRDYSFHIGIFTACRIYRRRLARLCGGYHSN